MSECLWMKHRDRPGGVWHLAVKPGIALIRLSNTNVTACRGDMLYGTMGPITQKFPELPKTAKCVRCTQIWCESQTQNT